MKKLRGYLILFFLFAAWLTSALYALGALKTIILNQQGE